MELEKFNMVKFANDLLKGGGMPEIGDLKTVSYEYQQRECCVCGEPAMHRMTFLYENPRRNPASSGYGKDDVSYCSDAEEFACEEHPDEVRANPPQGMIWCSGFHVKKNPDGSFINLGKVGYWFLKSETVTIAKESIEG